MVIAKKHRIAKKDHFVSVLFLEIEYVFIFD